jgi:hypothetical protein
MSSHRTPALVPGEARAPSASTQEIIHRDGRAVPASYEEVAYRFLGDGDIAFSRYTSQRFFDLEMDKMWNRTSRRLSEKRH